MADINYCSLIWSVLYWEWYITQPRQQVWLALWTSCNRQVSNTTTPYCLFPGKEPESHQEMMTTNSQEVLPNFCTMQFNIYQLLSIIELTMTDLSSIELTMVSLDHRVYYDFHLY